MDPKFKQTIDTLWPKTKKELEKAAQNTKVLIEKGEAQVKVISERSVQEVKRLSLSLKKDSLYFSLGRALAHTPRNQWSGNKKALRFLKEIKAIDRNLKGASRKGAS